MPTLRTRAVLARIVSMLCALALVLGAWARPAAAQFTVDELELHFYPDGSGGLTGVIPIQSELDSLQQIRVELADWERDSIGGNDFVEFGSLPSSCTGKVEVFPLTIQLAPRATEYVRVTYTGRQMPDPGCWAAVSIERVRPPTQQAGIAGITLQLVVAVKIYVHATGAQAAGEVISADVEQVWARGETQTDSMLVRQVAVRFNNTGTAHLRVKTSLEVRTENTQLAGRVEGPEAYITPSAFRDIIIRIPDLPRGRYAAIVLLDYGADEITAAQVEFEVP